MIARIIVILLCSVLCLVPRQGNAEGSNASDDCLFSWAETNFAELFSPAGSPSITAPPYYGRIYSETNAILATESNSGDLLYYGPASGYTIFNLGPVSGWYTASGCRPIVNLPEDYQAVLDGAVSDSGAPGAVMGVFSNDFWAVGASGVANLANQTPMTSDMQMRLASMTKTFTAALILRLVDEGLVGLDDTLDDWFPGKFDGGESMTVRMLLNHTGGLHDHQSTQELVDSILTTPERVWTQEETMNLITATTPDFIPGTSYSYSNAGYYVLGMIIDKASGMTVQEALTDRIFRHACIKRTEVIDGAVAAPAASFYSILLNQTELSNVTNWNLSWNWTAGAGVTTAADMIRFLQYLFGPNLLSQSTRDDEMMTVQAPAVQYGYGMNVKMYNGKVVVSHGGANPGNYGTWAYIPEINAGFFIGLNRLDMTDPAAISDQMQSIIDTMADMLLNQVRR